MTKAIENMNKKELIKAFRKLNDLQEDVEKLYKKGFGSRIGEEITDDELELINQTKLCLDEIILAKHYINERLYSEFKTFVM